MKISLKDIAKSISASQMAAIAQSGRVLHEPWMREYAYKSHQKAFWAEVQRVSQQLMESGRTVAGWISQMVRELPLAEEAPTPELYAEAADFILSWYRHSYLVPPHVGWTHHQHEKKAEQRRARLAALPPADFRAEWAGTRQVASRPYTFWERPAGPEELIELATPEQLATLTPADLGPLLASDDAGVRTAAIRALGRVSQPQEARKAA